MKKFDLIFEKAMMSLREQEYVDSTFEDNVRELAKALFTFLPQKETAQKTIESSVNQVIKHDKGVKELFLGPQVKKQIKLHVSQQGDSGTFQVEMVGEDVPENAEGKKIKIFSNDQHAENIFEDVAREIKTIAMSSPEDAVEQAPTEQGATAQPGAEQSALPGMGQEEQQSAAPAQV